MARVMTVAGMVVLLIGLSWRSFAWERGGGDGNAEKTLSPYFFIDA